MGGQALKYRVKLAKKTAQAVEEGKVEGKLKAMKGLDVTEQLKLFAEKLTDKLGLNDVMETVAIIGATVIIKAGIDWTQTPIPKAVIGLITRPHEGIKPLIGKMGVQVPLDNLINYLRGLTAEAPPETTQEEIMEWLMAFSLAYVIVHNFGAIASGASSILKIAGTLLAAA